MVAARDNTSCYIARVVLAHSPSLSIMVHRYCGMRLLKFFTYFSSSNNEFHEAHICYHSWSVFVTGTLLARTSLKMSSQISSRGIMSPTFPGHERALSCLCSENQSLIALAWWIGNRPCSKYSGPIVSKEAGRTTSVNSYLYVVVFRRPFNLRISLVPFDENNPHTIRESGMKTFSEPT